MQDCKVPGDVCSARGDLHFLARKLPGPFLSVRAAAKLRASPRLGFLL